MPSSHLFSIRRRHTWQHQKPEKLHPIYPQTQILNHRQNATNPAKAAMAETPHAVPKVAGAAPVKLAGAVADVFCCIGVVVFMYGGETGEYVAAA